MNFNRRQYIKSVGASVTLPFTSLETEEQEQEQEENEYSPVYATVQIQQYSLNLAHISIPSETLQKAEYIYTESGSTRLSKREVDDEWEILNVLVDGEIGSVWIDDMEVKKWDELSFDDIGLLFTGSSDHSYLDVFSLDEDLYRRRVDATSPSDIQIEKGGERVPIFEVNPQNCIN